MNKTNKKPFPFKKIILIILATILSLAITAILVVWFLWPVRSTQLQTAHQESFSFNESKQKIALINQQEKQAGVKKECLSKLYAHPGKTQKTVVMFHGISVCPTQFNALGEYFYSKGYNVYVARAPHHGMPNNPDHGKLTKQELVDFTNNSINIGDGLGEELGVVGLSGGANLATWAAEYRPEVKRLLALSPFYEPSVKQVPKWQIRPLLVLYGDNIAADTLNNPKDPQHALSYRVIAKYIAIFKNFKKSPQDNNLKKVAIVMAEDDDQIDQPLALKTLGAVADASNISLIQDEIPANYKLGHDIVGPTNPAVIPYQALLYEKYFTLYSE